VTTTEPEAVRLLRELVQQIEINDFKDSLGHDAHRLRPYVEAKQFLAEQAKARGALNTGDDNGSNEPNPTEGKDKPGE